MDTSLTPGPGRPEPSPAPRYRAAQRGERAGRPAAPRLKRALSPQGLPGPAPRLFPGSGGELPEGGGGTRVQPPAVSAEGSGEGERPSRPAAPRRQGRAGPHPRPVSPLALAPPPEGALGRSRAAEVAGATVSSSGDEPARARWPAESESLSMKSVEFRDDDEEPAPRPGASFWWGAGGERRQRPGAAGRPVSGGSPRRQGPRRVPQLLQGDLLQDLGQSNQVFIVRQK